MNEEEFWQIRSQKYNNLDWVNDSDYLRAIVENLNFSKNDLVLDVGTGTGVLANIVAPFVSEVIGLDISRDMLNHGQWRDNKYFIRGDVRELIFGDNIFDKITARMVFHHIVDGINKAMSECCRALKKGGQFVLVEGVPPCPEVRNDYIEIFKYKEERLTFLEEDLVSLMKQAGFAQVRVYPYCIKDFSVKNWLGNSGLPKETQEHILQLHLNGSDVFKKAYNLRATGDDCLIATKNLIIVAEK